jgi:Ca-activated chloride channel family protein
MQRFLLVPALAATLALNACGSEGAVGFSGAQDFGEFKAIVADGKIPGPETLDAGGFFAEHPIDRSEGLCDEVLCPRAMLSVHRDWVYHQYQALLHIDLTSALDPDDFVDAPLDIVVAVDTSRSMADDGRLAMVAGGLHTLIDGLEAGDRFGLVSYDSEARVVSALAEVSDADALHAAVDALVADGSTNLHDGLAVALAMAADARAEGRQSRVVLISDGLPSRGQTDPDTIVGLAANQAASGVAISTVGVGQDFDLELLRRIAERGGGGYYFLGSSEDAAEIFEEELRTVLWPIARAVEIVVRPGDGYRLGEAVGATPVEETAGLVRFVIEAVFFSTRRHGEPPGPEGERRRGGGGALFIEVLVNREVPAGELGSIDLGYLPLGATTRSETQITINNPLPAGMSEDNPSYSDIEMAKAYAVYNFFLGLREVARACKCTLGCGLWVSDELAWSADGFLARHPDVDIAADRDLLQRLDGNIRREMTRYGQKAVPECTTDANGFVCPSYDGCSLAASVAESGRRAQRSSLFVGLALCAAFALRRRSRRPS